MNLKTLPASLNLHGKRVLVRVDWNIPFKKSQITNHKSQVGVQNSFKIQRSLKTLKALTKRGAVVILLTHLGRPKGRDPKFSTRRLIPVLKRFGMKVEFLPGPFPLTKTKPGSIFLLENVRFDPGEETNNPKLAKTYASLGDFFVNDAFASSHRDHASVVGITKFLPSYAGSQLVAETRFLSRTLKHPKRPFIMVMGGGKGSTKLPLLAPLLKRCDRILIGGALAQAVMLDPRSARWIRQKKILLPVDVVMGGTKRRPIVADIGSKTIRAWSQEIQKAQTIVWNGPVGIIEVPAFAKGTHALAHLIARRAKGRPYGIVGGGDTLPIIFATHTDRQFDYVSTGGGALLEFIAKKGRLPGLLPLLKK